MVMAASGCSWLGDDGPDEDPTAQLGYPQSWIWYAAPGSTLNSPDARAVRGWVESQTLFQDARVSYPGFADAISADLINELMPAASGSQGGGTQRYLIRSISVSGGELRASLCSDGWDEFIFTSNGSYFDAETELAVRTLVMRKSGPTNSGAAKSMQQALVAGHQADPTPTTGGRRPYDTWLKGPTENVFDGWIAYEWDVSTQPPPDCVSWFKRNHPGLSFPTGYPLASRPNRPAVAPAPTLPASPGW